MSPVRHSRRPSRPLAALSALVLVAVGLITGPPGVASAADPVVVTAAGSFNSEIGCPGDWQPECTAAQLPMRENDGIYSATFTVPAGSYEYKIAIGGTWDENYGLGGVPGGANAPLVVTETGPVTFYYDHASHVFSTSLDGPVLTVPGSFQSELGCPADWSPDCMVSWLTDPDGDGTFTFTTSAIPTGNYEAKVAHNLSWDENYGVGGAPGGANYSFAASDGKAVTFSYVLSTHVLTITATDPPLPGTGTTQAFWVDETTLAWPRALLGDGTTVNGESWQLIHSSAADITTEDGVLVNGTVVDLALDEAGLTSDQLAAHPELTGYLALHPVGLDRAALESLLTEQILVASADADGTLIALTGVQLPGVLDDLYAADARKRELGVSWAGGVPTITVWAPTAQQVQVELGGSTSGGAPEGVSLPATRNDDGTWSVTGDASWRDVRFRFVLTVYAPSTRQIEVNTVTDPYSTALTANSEWSVAVDLADPAYRPAVWSDTPAPVVERPIDHSIYELHVRDFSITDDTVPVEARGKYAAFTYDSAGRRHLQQLAAAGLNTVHLLPTFDIASIPETGQLEPDCDLASFPADSPEQQACISEVAGADGYNWGYDPLHYSVPEGSYAVDPDGGARVAEFRSMVGALHANGLQVVLDQVFNHTAASGQDPKSVLDRVVPGYYQRLNPLGAVYTSTCCQNVATEHAMAEQLMVDSIVRWAADYKVDGFRFDLMGFHSRANMEAVRAALDELTVAEDGIDGSAVYLYGEGWNFGEVADNALFYQAIQGQLGGTGIGTFNDRIRDGVNGGSPVQSDSFQDQGFGNGLYTDPNDTGRFTPEQQLTELQRRTDWVKLGLAGNLRNFTFVTSDGSTKRGEEVDYNGVPAGYADSPEEVINYVDAHDNFTLFDGLTMKLPVDTTMTDRVRMNTLSLSLPTLSQGVTFWHAGTDLLRSKSLDHNSYDSGDWFNVIDWTGQDNGFGRGLPREADNSAQWPVDAPLLANPALKPTPADIATSSAAADELLALRYSTPLFRLGSAELINQKLSFLNSGPNATPGVIVMSIDDRVGPDVDPALNGLVVIFNAGPEPTTQNIGRIGSRNFQLSPIQAEGSDPRVKQTRVSASSGNITVPARTVAVLVDPTERAVSTIGLRSDPALPTYGKRITVTAAVNWAGGSQSDVPTGTVEFRSGDTVIGTAELGSNREATLVLPRTTPVGTYTIVASWPGSGAIPGATSAPLTITIGKAPSSTTLFAAGGRSGPLLFAAVVRLDNGQQARGTVEIRKGDVVVGRSPLYYGVALVLAPRPSPGTTSYTAVFVPSDSANIRSSSSKPVVIVR